MIIKTINVCVFFSSSNEEILYFYEYSCAQSCFACFSHCIVENSYYIKACRDRVFLHCGKLIINRSVLRKIINYACDKNIA